MKKIIIATAFVTFAGISHAQIFVGAQLGFNNTKATYEPNAGSKQELKTVSYTIAPMVGYRFNDKFAVGLRPAYASQKEIYPKYLGGNDDREEKTTLFGFDALAQYTFIQLNKFSVYAEAEVGFGKGKETYSLGSTTEDLNELTLWGINVKPVLAYDLTKKIRLIANLNFLSLGFASTTVKDLQRKDKETVKEFNFSFSSADITTVGLEVLNNGTGGIGTAGFIRIGFLYTF